jgi:HK97 family phage major capsid protein
MIMLDLLATGLLNGDIEHKADAPAPTAAEVKTAVDGLHSAWTEYKRTNDARIEEIKKGNGTASLEAKLEKIDAEIKRQGDIAARVSQMEAALQRGGSDKADKSGMTGAEAEYKAGLIKFLRHYDDRGLRELQAKAMSVGSDPNGGFTVTADMSGMIAKKVFESSPIRQLAAVQQISSDALEGIRDNDEPGGGWEAETTTTANTSTPIIGKWRVPTNTYAARPRITQQLLEDSSLNIEAWLIQALADKFARAEATAFVTGTGVARPRGFTTYAAGTTADTIEQIVTGSAAAVTFDGLISLVYGLKADYRKNATLAANRSTWSAVRKLKDSQNRYLWEPSLQAGMPAVVLGVPTAEFNDMADVAASSLSIAIADWKRAYQIADRVGMSILRDPFSAKPYVEFYARRRVGGDVVNTDAIKIQKTST